MNDKKELTDWIAFVASLAVMLVIGSFSSKADPYQIVMSLEFAHSPLEAKGIIDGVTSHSDGIAMLQLNDVLDIFFVFSYTSVLFFAAKIFLKPVYSTLPVWLTVAVLLPGFCDLAENVFIMLFTTHNYLDGSPLFYAAYKCFVRVKWLMAIPFAMMAVGVLIYLGLAVISFVVLLIDTLVSLFD